MTLKRSIRKYSTGMPKIILSTTEDDKYLFFLPIAVWCWKQMGWDAIVFLPEIRNSKLENVANLTLNICPETSFYRVPLNSKYKASTLMQCVRMYASCIHWNEEEYMMMGDIDLIPLSKDYFQRDEDKINYFGHDLTDFKHIPMCYVGMKRKNWKKVMQLDESRLEVQMDKDLSLFPENWGLDQDILTKKMTDFGLENCNQINRGKLRSGQAAGRVCRGFGFDTNTDRPIDAHLPRPGYGVAEFHQIMTLIKKYFTGYEWMIKYKNDYVK